MQRNGGITPGHPLQGPHFEERRGIPRLTALRLVLAAAAMEFHIDRPEVVIGRHSGADVRLAFPEISRRHCRLSFADGQWRLTDLDSTNGVFVNGVRMQEVNLYDGDRLQIGGLTFRIQLLALPLQNSSGPRPAFSVE